MTAECVVQHYTRLHGWVEVLSYFRLNIFHWAGSVKYVA